MQTTDIQSTSETETTSLLTGNYKENEDLKPLRCWDCNVSYTSKKSLYEHLNNNHIKQPRIILTPIPLPPLKLTIKNTSGKHFEIVHSPSGESNSSTNSKPPSNLADDEDFTSEAQEAPEQPEEQDDPIPIVSFSPNFAEVEGAPSSPVDSDSGVKSGGDLDAGSPRTSDYGTESTPPPADSDFPKIRIKTGLLKEPLTITEITDDVTESEPDKSKNTTFWNNSTEDPLKINDDILAIFNNNERAKDFGFTTSDSEFMPMESLESRNRNAMQLYNPNQNAISNITGVPMQALAQQVSRLQPPSNGVHQQNVLINIQQFPQAPPPSFQPPMFHHPHPQMYHPPYQAYQQPSPLYYTTGPSYPPQHMAPPPQSQHPQMQPPMVGQQPMMPPQMVQPPNQSQQPQQNMPPVSQAYGNRQPPPPRPPGPRPLQSRMPLGMNPRHPLVGRPPLPRHRAPLVRPRGSAMAGTRGPRPRMPMNSPNTGQLRPLQQQAIKRSPEQMQTLTTVKKKRFDFLTPDKDDEDCQVICMQPKNTDGGLPQIQSVQGGTSEPAENSIMHLSDSITLSVRNPQVRPQSPKKSDAKAVANILATRGITVTATPKSKEKAEAQKNSSALPSALNLNGAVSIIPSAKTAQTKPQTSATGQESHLPTVDLTDDLSPMNQANGQKTNQRTGLPFKCDLCPAQYPNGIGLSKHRKNYHKTESGMCEIGVPLINLKQPGIFQKLSSLGIFNYIPLPAAGSDGMFALPIINGRNPGNVGAMGATTMLTLGPVRSIPRAQAPSPNGTKPIANNQKS